MYFYKEDLDGTWLRANEFDSGSSSVNFNISDKYNGYEAYQYSTDGESTWKAVGTYNANTGYYGSQVSGSKLSIRFKRKQYELTYMDGDNELNKGNKITVPYEVPLTSYDLAVTNSLLNWGARDTSASTFKGWYEDASLTVPFDFTGTMPDGKKFLYAKWAPLEHKTIIDPNGGELQSGDSTWFYLDEGEKLIEYTVTRNYRLDMHNGTYYYHHDLWDPVKDKHTDQYDPATANAPRRAYYTTNILEATSNAVSDPGQRYSLDPGAYSFMGWFEVHEDGTLATDPFNFVDPPNRPITVRAIWRRMGVYTLKYESIDPDGVQNTEIIYDPPPAENGNFEDGYIDDAGTTLAKIPSNYDKDKWIWEGWQAVDTANNNIPLTTIRSPGDTYIVRAEHADIQNVIHFRAVYKSIDDTSSRHIPSVTDLILDSNANAGLATDATITTEAGRIGTYTGGSAGSVSGLNQGVWFAGQQNNLSVNLADYTEDFEHVDGYFLLGWDPLRNVSSMIPAHYANETIGIDKTSNDENILYAVWEPQIYIDFVNDTGADLHGVQLYIPGWAEGEIFRVNSKHDTYRRSVFSAFQNGQATFDIPAGEHICLVLPDGADKDFTVGGTCSYVEGTKLVVSRIQPQIEGQEAIPDVTQSVYPGDTYMIAGTMRVNPTPVQVRFTNETYRATTDVPVRYFIHDPDGTVTEITADSSKWDSGSFNNVKKTLTGIGSSTNDISYLLRKSSTAGVHEYLVQSIRDQYGYTTVGIGAAIGDFEEWRSITKDGPSGGSYIRFYHEKLEWSRYSQIWNDYENAAVYVVFYKRIPVHVTTVKNVIGSEEDKDKTFNFTATFEEHSKTIEYKVVTTYKRTRSWSLFGGYSDWDNENGIVQSSVTNSYRTITSEADQQLFSPTRDSETFTLKTGDRHPITIYFNNDENSVDSGTTSWSSGNTSQTRTQTVTYTVTYQYETAIIQEAETNLFTLTSISGESGHGHSGTGNESQRTYTVSSKKDVGSNGLATYTPLDTTIFTNTRKTGSVTVTKTVEGGDANDAGDTFQFTVTLGETVVNKDNYTPPAGVNLGPYGKVFTFTLGHGDSVTLPGLPAGASYTVVEGAHNKYVATVPNNASGTIVEAGTTVAYVNTRKTDLSIVINNRTEYFTGDELQGWDISSVTGTGETISTDAYKVTGLKNGHVLTVEHYVAAHGTAVGSYTGRVENAVFTVRDANDENVTQQYVITATPGVLTIEGTPIVVTVTGNHETKVYNGTEQECSGYTYVITHATTHETIVNDNIHVAINSEFQTARRKDVGRSAMYLEPIRVIVTPPTGISVSSIIVAANGYIEITPAQVTVTANDASKLPGANEPTYTATVEGVIGEDTVTYTVSRTESGEAVGEYAIMPAGEASQCNGNYTVTYVGGKLTIANPSLTQRSTGSGIMVEGVSFTPEFLASSDLPSDSTPDSINEIMNAVDENGLMRWENLRLGLATNQVPLGTETGTSDGMVSVGMPPSTGKMADWGYDVLYELRKRNESDSSWSRVAGPVSSASSEKLGIELVDAQGNSTKPTGLYRLVTLIVPRTNLSVTNEIPATNIIGVLEVDSAITNTVVAVPWKQLASDPKHAGNITVANYVSSLNLTPGDHVYAFEEIPSKGASTSGGATYMMWTLQSDGMWTSATTIKSTEAGYSVMSVAEDAETKEFARTQAVWLQRQRPLDKDGNPVPFFLIGQYDSDGVEITVKGGTSSEPGYTLLSVPDYRDYYINDLDWSGYASTADSTDFIRVVDGAQSFLLKWSDGKWCTEEVNYRRGRPAGMKYVPYETPFKAGTGFWFCRHGGEFTIKWAPSEEVQ